MFDSQNGGGTGLVTAYATFEGMQPQTDETIMYHRLRSAMKERLAEEEAARPPGQTEALARRMAGDRKAVLKQMQRKPEKAARAGKGDAERRGPPTDEKAEKGGPPTDEKAETGARRAQGPFWRRVWCFA